MSDKILDTLAECTRKRIEKNKAEIPLEQLKEQAFSLNTDTGFPFERALSKAGMSYICEIKKASPSKGIIAEDFPYVEIAKEYQSAGASAISVLTETDYFLGSDQYVKEVSKAVNIPIIRKDFTVDEYMLYQEKAM